MDIKDSIFHDFKLTKAKHKKIAIFSAIWPQCGLAFLKTLLQIGHIYC